MIAPPLPANEAVRLAALESYDILDTERELAYDDFTALAAEICDTPIALIALIDEKRQWFKSAFGLALGTLCVIDRVARKLTDGQRNALEALSRQLMTHLELRRAMVTLRDAEQIKLGWPFPRRWRKATAGRSRLAMHPVAAPGSPSCCRFGRSNAKISRRSNQ